MIQKFKVEEKNFQELVNICKSVFPDAKIIVYKPKQTKEVKK